MFEIGSALREARERRGLSYSQVEEGTKIRARYIRALEDEDFGVLPGATYSKGFLRAYADYLGLDGHLFIDEFNSRYHDPRHRRETSIVLIALAAIVAIASLVFLGAGSGGTPNAPLPTPSTTTHNPKSTQSSSTSSGGSSQGTTTKSTKHRQAAAKTYRITVTAATGDSWLSAHLGSAAGPAAKTIHHTDLSNYLLQQGGQAVIQAKGTVVVSLGAPGNVTITVAGHPQTLPHGISSFKITKQGIAKA
jgi:transcriptional regulator with XRE-family HTH domain